MAVGWLLCAVLGAMSVASASPESEVEKRLNLHLFRRAEAVPELESGASPSGSAEGEAEDETAFKWTCVVGILALSCTFIFGQILERHHITWLPEAAVGVLMGLCAGGVAVATGNHEMLSHERFDFEFFMVYLLPPIIFEAGFNMNVKAFVDNIGPTMFFAFLGTFASTFIVGFIVWYAGQLGLCYPLGLLASLVFGSLISATDPVTVLAVFQVRDTEM